MKDLNVYMTYKQQITPFCLILKAVSARKRTHFLYKNDNRKIFTFSVHHNKLQQLHQRYPKIK